MPKVKRKKPSARAERGGEIMVRVPQNDHVMYVGAIRASELFPLCVVTPYEPTEDSAGGGFQRVLDPKRAKSLAEYVTKWRMSIPGGLVLFATEDAGLRYDAATLRLTWNKAPRVLIGGDGQHRLYGFHIAASEMNTDHMVIVTIYEPIAEVMQARLFDDINDKQVGLPSSLRLRIKELAGSETAKETAIRELFDRLSGDPQSPLYGRTSLTRTVAGKLASIAFARAIGPVLRDKTWSGMADELRYKVLFNFLAVWSKALGRERAGDLVRSGYFAAMCDVFPDVLARVTAAKGHLQAKDFAPVVAPLAALAPMLNGRALPKGIMAERLRASLRDAAGTAISSEVKA